MQETWSIQEARGENGQIYTVTWSISFVDGEHIASHTGKDVLQTSIPSSSSEAEILSAVQEVIPQSVVDGARSYALYVIRESKAVAELQQYTNIYFGQDTVVDEIRRKRDQLLAECDWVAAKSYDTGVILSDWAAYRQALRDITTQETFPNSVVWPTKPE